LLEFPQKGTTLATDRKRKADKDYDGAITWLLEYIRREPIATAVSIGIILAALINSVVAFACGIAAVLIVNYCISE
jgi:hypothetical protein